jgi:anaerobic magnesium-protoporphyrin IX monomethyl ester cyclase
MRGFIKSELFTNEQAQAMYAAGFRWILVGFESGDPRILLNMDKKATRDDNTRCIETAHRHGLKVKALMSIGHAGESAESIHETEKWLRDVQPADFDCTVITTYPGTPYFDESLESSPGVWTYTQPKTGDRLHATEVDFHRTASYYKGMPGHYTANTWTDHLKSEELVTLRDELENRVRSALKIPYPSGAAPKAFEHSMGQNK